MDVVVLIIESGYGVDANVFFSNDACVAYMHKYTEREWHRYFDSEPPDDSLERSERYWAQAWIEGEDMTVIETQVKSLEDVYGDGE